VDPVLVQELVAVRRADDPLAALTARKREVLALMAEGRSNAGIGQAWWVAEGTVEKARAQHLDEAAVAGDRRRSSSGAGRARVPGCALTPRLLLAAMRAISSAEKMG
jgi:Bacterial regulatory proteins, luxR family